MKIKDSAHALTDVQTESYFAWSAKAMIPEAIAAVPEVPGYRSVQSLAPLVVTY